MWIAVAFLCCWAGFQISIGDRIVDKALSWPLAYRFALAAALLSGPAFFLGWPFPMGLRELSQRFPVLVPWAWGINASASVVGAILGKCLAITLGFQAFMLMACGLYLAAAMIFRLLFGGSQRGAIS